MTRHGPIDATVNGAPVYSDGSVGDRPLNGADSADGWDPHEWRVTMCDRFEPTIRFDVRIEAAIGRHDALSQARERHPEASALDAREVAA